MRFNVHIIGRKHQHTIASFEWQLDAEYAARLYIEPHNARLPAPTSYDVVDSEDQSTVVGKVVLTVEDIFDETH